MKHGRVTEPSKLFLYQITLQGQGTRDDVGADLRSTLKALIRCGTPPEASWPYQLERLAQEPTGPFLSSFASDYHSIGYSRLDHHDATGSKTLDRVKSLLTAGFPSAFGFAVPSSLSREPNIPFRPDSDRVRGGQAAVAIGYDDKRRIGSQTGALLIRNSWGTAWGDAGHGWLPYGYVEHRYAVDFWTLLKSDWLASGEFARPVIATTLSPA